MVSVSFGDLAQNFQLRRESARIDASIQRLSSELTTGRKTDLSAALSGDLRQISGIEDSLQRVSAREITLNEASFVAESGQFVLGQLASDVNQLANTLIVLDQASSAQLINAGSAEASSKFSSAISSLNTQVAGRSLFAGEAFDQPAFSDPTTILNDLYAVASLEANSSDVLNAVDLWFAPGGAFVLNHYSGAVITDQIQLGDGATADPLPIAIQPDIIESLKGMAIGALVDMGILVGQQNERVELARTAGERLLSSHNALVNVQADIGITQERIENSKVKFSFERTSLELSRSEFMDIDPFETATRLQSAEAQLRTLYSITGRLSDLSLTNYLR